MAEKVHRIHSLPGDAPWVGGIPPVGSDEHPLTIRALDRVLAIQRPAVLAHLRSIRLRHPHSSTAQIVRHLERRYLAAVTTGGAAVGATAVVPGIGTGMTLALSGVETVGFLEATTLFAQSVAEVHGIPVADPDRARALVFTLMLGKEGVDLVAQLAGQASGKGVSRDRYWGELITKTLPRAAVSPLVDRLKTSFIRQFARKGGASIIGKALPFGIGAVIGGTGNNILGRRVVVGARAAFGVPPIVVPSDIEPRPGARRLEHSATRGMRRAGGAIAGAAQRGGAAVGGAGKRLLNAPRPRAVMRETAEGAVVSEPSARPEIVELESQDWAVVRETVPMNALAEFFGRAFAAAAAVAGAQGSSILGPPAAIYFGMPTDTVDVAAGFPVGEAVTPADGVTALRLPGGRAAQVLHVGSYDSLPEGYGRLMAWLEERNETPGSVMWESYLNEPDDDAPDSSRTLIVWPLDS